MVMEDKTNPDVASLWSRIQFMYLGRKSIARWLIPLLGLTAIVLILRWATAPMGTVSYHSDEDFRFRHIDELDIHAHLESLPDTRSPQCISHPYKDLEKEKVSIILDFHEKQFYDLKLTLESILRFTPDNLYEEILLLDDGSGDDSVKRNAARYLSDTKFRKVKAFRSESRDGPSLSRFKASKLATGSVLIFLSCEVVVTQGWIQPLVSHVRLEPRTIVAPHEDSILAGFKYFKTPEYNVNVFNMNLTTLLYKLAKEEEVMDTPVMTGTAFAVEKRYLDSIGSFDDGLGKGGGENLELSLRAGMCGGAVKITRCSRVAVRNALAPKKIESAKNFQRIAELWLGDVKRLAYGQRGHAFDPSDDIKYSLQIRKQYLKKTVQCSSFKEYMERVAPMIVTPPHSARYFGQVRSRTGYCIFNELLNHGRMKMDHCKPHIYDPTTFFEYDRMGRISRRGKCIELTGDGEVRFTPCDDKNADQFWEYDKSGMIESASKKNKCLSYYYDEVSQYSYVKAQDCAPEDRTMAWSFVKF